MIDWSRVDTVILDMDGTVLDLHFDNRFWLQHLPAIYADRKGLPREEGLNDLLSRFAAHQGSLNWYCVDFWSEQVGFDVAVLKEDLRHLIRERADHIATLLTLEQGKPIGEARGEATEGRGRAGAGQSFLTGGTQNP